MALYMIEQDFHFCGEATRFFKFKSKLVEENQAEAISHSILLQIHNTTKT